MFALAAGGCGGGGSKIYNGDIPIDDIPIDIPDLPVEEDLLEVTPTSLFLRVGEAG